ncbi:hypothetical protein [Peribacillus frigoritolerans]|uniref:Phage protein n=1 Tax=Peribacillus castrilensis TaxID=2897690 RepID=A0AAW9NEJ4_9BACI|nr:hypothetical protein [Peribacillus castrilensis]
MKVKFTYALNRDEIHTIEMITQAQDILDAYEEAVEYLMENHKPTEIINLVAFSLLKIEEDKEDESTN